ncbi:hypothetical protein IWQ62_000965 [Dispira parvispora]|uniref:Uncharacterized protein n=1 Tax=Dispira parvispora TaxID=1520584 RepID=A0A9W8AW21_9FUNG|nr:hypothetical protein IWQ62_000965 [Dispira parvispora]
MHATLLTTAMVLGTGLLVTAVPAPASGGDGQAHALSPQEFGKNPSLPASTLSQPSQSMERSNMQSSNHPMSNSAGNSPFPNESEPQPSSLSITADDNPSNSNMISDNKPGSSSPTGGIKMPPSDNGRDRNEEAMSPSKMDSQTSKSMDDNSLNDLESKGSSTSPRGKNSSSTNSTLDDSLPMDSGNFAATTIPFTVAAAIIPLLAACSMY